MGFFKNRPLALFCAIFVLTVTACELVFFSPALLSVSLAALGISVAALIFIGIRSEKFKKPLAFTTLCILCVIAGLFSHFFAVYREERRLCATNGEVEIAGEIGECLYKSNGESFYSLSVYYVNASKSSGKVLFSHSSREPLESGTVVRSTAILQRPQNTVAYSERTYLHSKGISAVAVIEDGAKTVIIGKASSVSSAVIKFRNAITERINTASRSGDSGLLAALLTGSRDGIDPTVSLDFSRAGISHLLAISGLHFTVIASAVLSLLKALKIKRGWRSVLVCTVSLAYAFIAGFSYSVLRAMLMLFSVHCASLFSRSRDVYTSLFGAVALITVIEPTAVASCGMWMSFLATLGVVFAARISGRLRERLTDEHTWAQRVFSVAAEPLIVGVFAVLLPLPVSLMVFGTISPISPLTTLLCAPLIEALMLFSVLFAIVGAPMGIVTDLANSLSALSVSLARLISDNIEPISTKQPLLCGVFVAAAMFVYIAILIPRARKRALALLLCSIVVFPVCSGANALINNGALIFSAQSRAGADVLCVANSRYTVAIAPSNASSGCVNATAEAVSGMGKTDIDLLILSELTDSSDDLVLKLSAKIKIRAVAYPAADITQKQTEIDVMRAAKAIRASAHSYSQSVRAASTEITLHGENRNDLFISITEKNASLLYLSEGAQESGAAPIRALLQDCDALILGIAGTNENSAIDITGGGVRCVVLPSKSYTEDLSPRTREYLERINVQYADTEFSVRLQTD